MGIIMVPFVFLARRTNIMNIILPVCRWRFSHEMFTMNSFASFTVSSDTPSTEVETVVFKFKSLNLMCGRRVSFICILFPLILNYTPSFWVSHWGVVLSEAAVLLLYKWQNGSHIWRQMFWNISSKFYLLLNNSTSNRTDTQWHWYLLIVNLDFVFHLHSVWVWQSGIKRTIHFFQNISGYIWNTLFII